MHHRHEFVFHSLRHVEPMEVDTHKLRQSTIELLSVTDKTSSRIQETLFCQWNAVESSGLIPGMMTLGSCSYMCTSVKKQYCLVLAIPVAERK